MPAATDLTKLNFNFTAMRYQAVLLDIDGTLVDSNDAHAHAWVKALGLHGYDVAFQVVRSRIGMGGDKLLQEVAGIDSESPQGHSISEARRAIFSAEHLLTLQPTPGARRMVEWLKKEGMRIVIATSAPENEVTGLLRAAGVADLIDRIASSDDADESKPDPDIVLAALAKSGARKEHAIMLGDTPYDILSASLAGIPTVAFRTGGWADTDLRNALAIFDDPDDLVTRVTESPFGAQ
jgi:HAD superfamily hydrolase (TIGR01549 family)